MRSTPAAELDAAFRTAVAELSTGEPARGGCVPGQLTTLFDAQAASRHLDLIARDLQAAGQGFYTIGSAGHESNAAVALALRPSDPALLHYRSGGFYLARAGQVKGSTPVRDVLQGLMTLADEPMAGGRHKVFGHQALSVIPQTSTIASHLPRAVGLALSLHRAGRLGADCPWPSDAVVVCSFGDASANHSTATGAINTALNTAYRGLPVPILFVCEDNGLGISVPTPAGWIEHAYGHRLGLTYLASDGSDPGQTMTVADQAAQLVRATRLPVFLHLETVRFLAHAGSDAEISYRKPTDVQADYARDPLLGTARALVGAGMPAEAVLARYQAAGAEVADVARRLAGDRRLETAQQVMEPLARRTPAAVSESARALRSDAEPGAPATLAESINASLAGILAAEPRALVFGEDVGVKGGVYGVTRGLARRHGSARVFDTVLDEQSILGLALGAGLAGLLPIPEIQYLAYLHNAEDQLRGEAASLPFFSQGQYRNPMVVRIAGLGYQKGFGGHFHNDNAVGVLRDIPGLVVACPARGDDAAAMLRTCFAAARVDGSVSVVVEPIALYHTRDLHASGDNGWLSVDTGADIPIGSARTYPAPDASRPADLTIVTFGNGVPMSLRVAASLAGQGVQARVLDLRWLSPLPVQDLFREAEATGRVLVADETRHSGGVGEGVITTLVEHGFTGPMARVSSQDSFVPLGAAAQLVLMSELQIEQAASGLAGIRGVTEKDIR
ncbi:MAG: thiamine pyrophosphate-dependent enzyme [Propionibacteriaceae bacterium]